MTRRIFPTLPMLLVVLASAGPLLAGEARDEFRPVPLKKDPVAMAFALPRGIVLTPEEMKVAMQLRARLEPRLRDALERVENATDKNEKLKAVKEVRQVREEIRAALGSILHARYVRAAQQYAKKRAEQIKAARKRASQHKNRRGHQERRGRSKKGRRR